VEAHNGSVEIVEGQSGGAYFIVKLPHDQGEGKGELHDD